MGNTAAQGLEGPAARCFVGSTALFSLNSGEQFPFLLLSEVQLLQQQLLGYKGSDSISQPHS